MDGSIQKFLDIEERTSKGAMLLSRVVRIIYFEKIIDSQRDLIHRCYLLWDVSYSEIGCFGDVSI